VAVSYTREQRAIAERDGLALVTFDIDARLVPRGVIEGLKFTPGAAECPSGRVTIDGPADPALAAEMYRDFLKLWLRRTKRARPGQ
jgi:hypothetical protein